MKIIPSIVFLLLIATSQNANSITYKSARFNVSDSPSMIKHKCENICMRDHMMTWTGRCATTLLHKESTTCYIINVPTLPGGNGYCICE